MVGWDSHNYGLLLVPQSLPGKLPGLEASGTRAEGCSVAGYARLYIRIAPGRSCEGGVPSKRA